MIASNGLFFKFRVIIPSNTRVSVL